AAPACLSGRQRVSPPLPLPVRSVRPPKVVQIEPRATKLLGSPVVFEWSGSDTLRYTVRLLGPQGQIWEQESLPRKPLTYPSSAPAPEPRIRYPWQLEPPGHPMRPAEVHDPAPA